MNKTSLLTLVAALLALAVLCLAEAPARSTVAPAPWIRVTTTGYTVDGGDFVATEQPLAEALRHAQPGSTVEVEPGEYPVLRLGFGRGKDNADCSGTASAPIRIKAAYPGPNKPRINAIGKSDALMIDQKQPVQHITFEGFRFDPGYRSAIIFYKQGEAKVHRGFRFLDCDIIGSWDHVAAKGEQSKWGVWASRLADFEWRGVMAPSIIRDIKNEHAFYIQNNAGDVRIENVEASRLGRTFVQFTSRAVDGPQGVGQVVVRDCKVTDPCIAAGDAYKGGSAFTVVGNMPKVDFLFEGNTYRAGFDPRVRKLTRKGVAYGTGAFVSWSSKEKERAGTIVLKDNDFKMAAGCGDRPLVALSAAQKVVLEGQNQFVAGKFGVALSIDPPTGSGVPSPLPVKQVKLDPRTQIEGRVEFKGRPASADERRAWGLPGD